jgi:hypothetical protein
MFKYDDLQLFLNDVEYFLDFDFIIKKAKFAENDVINGGKATAEVTLYNFNSYNLQHFKIINNGIILFDGVVDAVKTYKSATSKYSVFNLVEVVGDDASKQQDSFMEQLFFLKNEDITKFFTVAKTLILKSNVFFNGEETLEKRVDVVLKNCGVKNYFFDKSTNTIILKNTVEKNKLEVIDSNITTTYKNMQNKNITVINEAIFKAKTNIYLQILDFLNFDGLVLYVIDITISGGTNSGVIMEVTANDLQEEAEEEGEEE